MDNTEYLIFDEQKKEVQKVSEEKYREHHTVGQNAQQNAQMTASEQKQATLDYLSGIKARTRVIIPAQTVQDKEGGEFYKEQLTAEKRNEKAALLGTELYRKKDNALKIEGARKKRLADTEKYAKKLSQTHHLDIKEVRKKAAFFTGNAARDKALFDKNGTETLKAVIQQFMAMDPGQKNISTDTKLAGNATFLEKLTDQYDAIRNLIAEYKTDYDALPQETVKAFEKRLGEVTGIVNYYRIMRRVITNEYYRTHENKELGKKSRETDTEDQKLLAKLLKEAKGSLAALQQNTAPVATASAAYDQELKKVVDGMQLNGVSEKQLEFQRFLSDRKKAIEKEGLGRFLYLQDRFGVQEEEKDRLSSDTLIRARESMKALTLQEDVENATDLLPQILNQLDEIDLISKEKLQSPQHYHLEHNAREIAIMEELQKAGDTLRKIKNTLFASLNANEKGELTFAVKGQADRRRIREEYLRAKEAYGISMRKVEELRTGGTLLLQKELSPQEAGEDAAAKATDQEKSKEAVEQRYMDLIAVMTEAEFSDYAIYTHAAEIATLYKLSNNILGTQDRDVLETMSKLATVIWEDKRHRDAEAALESRELTEEQREELNKIIESTKRIDHLDQLNERNLNTLREEQLQLKSKAQRMKYDTEDLKAEARHYLFQEEWSKTAYSARVVDQEFVRENTNWTVRLPRWLLGEKRTASHGAQNYEAAKQMFQKFPPEYQDLGEKGTRHVLQYGSGNYAPVVELDQYFPDSMKLKLAEEYRQIVGQMMPNADYPAELQTAVEALGYYTRVRGIVNYDTTEMEYAFLDKFKKCVEQLIGEPEIVDRYSELVQLLLKTYQGLQITTNGNLLSKMTKEEMEAVKDLKAVYTTKTLYGDSAESNMKDMPLFTHEPHMNDIRQGLIGNCYMMCATQTLTMSDPQAIRDMFYDLGNGDVLVRFYARYGVIKGQDGQEDYYGRIDDACINENVKDTEIRPVYVKVRKHYETGEYSNRDCMWVQLLEKAYAAAGFNSHVSKVDEKGELDGMLNELTAGRGEDIMFHLTGRQMKIYKHKQHDLYKRTDRELLENEVYKEHRMRAMFASVPLHLHAALYEKIAALSTKERDESDPKWLNRELCRILQETATAQDQKIQSELLPEVVKAIQAGKITQKEAENLQKVMVKQYKIRAEILANKIETNILEPDKAVQFAELSGVGSLEETINALKTALQKDNVNAKDLENIIKKKKVYYQQRAGAVLDEQEERALRTSLKGVTGYNPEGRYTGAAMSVLHDILKEVRKGKRLMGSFWGSHEMSILDAKLHNGRWFILIRDTGNFRHMQYRKDTQGNVEKRRDQDRDAVVNYKSLRSLTGDQKVAFHGISWWELNDVAELYGGFVTFKDEKKVDGNK